MKTTKVLFRGAAALALLAVAGPALPCGDKVSVAMKEAAPPAFTVQAPRPAPAVASKVSADKAGSKTAKATSTPRPSVAAN